MNVDVDVDGIEEGQQTESKEGSVDLWAGERKESKESKAKRGVIMVGGVCYKGGRLFERNPFNIFQQEEK